MEMPNRVLYMEMTEDKLYSMSYDFKPTDKKSPNTPANHIVTTTGYELFIPGSTYKFADIQQVDIFIDNREKLTIHDKILLLIIDNLHTNLLIKLVNKDIYNVCMYLQHGSAEHTLLDSAFTIDESMLNSYRDKYNTCLKNATVKEITHKYVFEDIIQWYNKILNNFPIGDEVYKKTFDGKQYWKKINLRIDMLYGKYIVIDPDEFYQEDDKYKFMAVKYPTVEELGRNLSMITESEIFTNDLPEIFLIIVKRMIQCMGDDRRLFIMDMGILSNTLIMKPILDFDNTLIEKVDRIGFSLENLHGDIITHTIKVPGLSIKLKETIGRMHESVNGSMDITDMIYTKKPNGKHIDKIDWIINPEIPQSKHIIHVDVDGVDIKIMLGVDTLDRNTFKRIEKKVLSVFLNYYYKKKLIKYFTTIVLDNGIILSHSPYNSINIRK